MNSAMSDNGVSTQSEGITPSKGLYSESQAVHIVLICSSKLLFPTLRFKPLNYCLQRNIGGFMEELIEVIQGLKQPGCIDYIQLGSAIVSVIASIIAVFVAIRVLKTIAENQNKIALFEKRYELFQFYRKCQSFLYLEFTI